MLALPQPALHRNGLTTGLLPLFHPNMPMPGMPEIPLAAP